MHGYNSESKKKGAYFRAYEVGFEKMGDYSLIIWFPFFEFSEKFRKLEDVHHTFEIVQGKNKCHLTIHFFKALEIGVIVSPFSLYRAKNMFINTAV